METIQEKPALRMTVRVTVRQSVWWGLLTRVRQHEFCFNATPGQHPLMDEGGVRIDVAIERR